MRSPRVAAGVWASPGDSGGRTVRGAWGMHLGAPQDDLADNGIGLWVPGISQILLGGERGPERGSGGGQQNS